MNTQFIIAIIYIKKIILYPIYKFYDFFNKSKDNSPKPFADGLNNEIISSTYFRTSKFIVGMDPIHAKIFCNPYSYSAFNEKTLDGLLIENRFEIYFETNEKISEEIKIQIIALIKQIKAYEGVNIATLPLTKLKDLTIDVPPEAYGNLTDPAYNFFTENAEKIIDLGYFYIGWKEIFVEGLSPYTDEYTDILRLVVKSTKEFYSTDIDTLKEAGAQTHIISQNTRVTYHIISKVSEHILNNIQESLRTLKKSDIEEGKKLYKLLNILLNVPPLNSRNLRVSIEEDTLYLEIANTKNLCAKKFNIEKWGIDDSDLLEIGKQRQFYADLKVMFHCWGHFCFVDNRIFPDRNNLEECRRMKDYIKVYAAIYFDHVGQIYYVDGGLH